MFQRSWIISLAGRIKLWSGTPTRPIRLQLVEYRAIRRDQHRHQRWIKHVHRRDDVALVTLLENVGVAVMSACSPSSCSKNWMRFW